MSDRNLSPEPSRDSVPSVEVERNVSEDEQIESFANATLQHSTDGRWAVSIATYLEIPEFASENQGHVVEYIKALLGSAAENAGDPGVLIFDVKLGRSDEYDILEIERQEREQLAQLEREAFDPYLGDLLDDDEWGGDE